MLRLAQLDQLFAKEGFSVYNFDCAAAERALVRLPTQLKRDRIVKQLNWFKEYSRLLETKKVLKQRLSPSGISTESEVAAGTTRDGAITSSIRDENFLDVAGFQHDKVSAGTAADVPTGQKGILDISNFLSRPVEIYSEDVKIGDELLAAISPWDLWSKVVSVRAKLKNFAYFKGDLHIRVAISGSPFHSGRLMLSYQPYAFVNQNLSALVTANGLEPNFRPLLLNYLSQAPGVRYMNVNANCPLEITLPFISPKPMFRLYNTSNTAVAAADSFDDFACAGDLYLMTLQTIEAVSATATPISIQVYAWVEDVHLGVPTATQLAISTESEKVETKVGPLQRNASKAIKVTKILSRIPILTQAMDVAAMGFGMVRDVAAVLGWSRPTREEPPLVILNRSIDCGALTIGSSSAHKLTTDPRQNLSIDPKVCGSTTDDMVIAEIASRPTWLTSFTWGASDTLLDYIWGLGVTPNNVTYYIDSVSTKVFSQPTAMAFAVAPFAFWRGDITYRFDVVCSQFHRGKLAVFFEPNIPQFNLITGSQSLNKQFIEVIDIQETQTFEVTINWASHYAWLKVMAANTAYYALENPFSSTFYDGFYNGAIGVFPFTALQSPDDSDVIVNVSVFCNNLQVNYPTTANTPFYRKTYAPAAPIMEEKSMDISAESLSCESQFDSAVTNTVLNPTTASTVTICEEYFGEQVVSFRSLMKRFVSPTLTATLQSVNAQWYRYIWPIFPASSLTFGQTAAVTKSDLFSYLRYAYLGCRGGIRYRFPPGGTTNGVRMSTWVMGTTQTASGGLITDAETPLRASQMHPNSQTQMYEIEFPFVSNNLFFFPMSETLDMSTSYAGAIERTWLRLFAYEQGVVSSGVTNISIFRPDIATAEDFDFMRFQGGVYYTGDPVA